MSNHGTETFIQTFAVIAFVTMIGGSAWWYVDTTKKVEAREATTREERLRLIEAKAMEHHAKSLVSAAPRSAEPKRQGILWMIQRFRTGDGHHGNAYLYLDNP